MILHDSRDPFYRAPFGAQPCETPITIRLRSDEPAEGVQLRLWWDGREILIPMAPESPGVYRADCALPQRPGLLWYHFVIVRSGGDRTYYGNAHDLMGGVGAAYPSEPPGYQITVYDPGYETPEWMRTGVMYHIVVDRFRASDAAAHRGAPAGGRLHADWHEDPDLRLDGGGADNLADDFFGGDLRGIESKLPYLRDLGVTALYLSPVFQARSNHKYDTGDYERIDPSFGDEADFRSLCASARALGIRVMLDGVFSHTGSDSRYFNREGRYAEVGAHQSRDSAYYPWYRFFDWPDRYESWWGFETLPVLDKRESSFLEYILRAEDSVFARWIRAGAAGWRLDVADELPMEMLREMRARLKREDPEGALLGEVWEDASCKVAYGELRCYCLGDALDSAMNYPLREALLDFLLGRGGAARFVRRVDDLRECYPPPFFSALMNLIGSHDRARAINVLSGAGDMEPPRAQRSARRLTPDQYALGRARLLLALRAILALPGMPCLYYGDEAGAQGMTDPFCRGTYPWGREDRALLSGVRAMIHARRDDPLWSLGALALHAPHEDVLVIERTYQGRKMLCALNRSDRPLTVEVGGAALRVPALGAAVERAR